MENSRDEISKDGEAYSGSQDDNGEAETLLFVSPNHYFNIMPVGGNHQRLRSYWACDQMEDEAQRV